MRYITSIFIFLYIKHSITVTAFDAETRLYFGSSRRRIYNLTSIGIICCLCACCEKKKLTGNIAYDYSPDFTLHTTC